MKSLKFILASLIILVSMISCDTYYDGYSHRNNDYYYNGQQYKKLPLGQAKKMYGGSAKDYAPSNKKNIIANMINFSL